MKQLPALKSIDLFDWCPELVWKGFRLGKLLSHSLKVDGDLLVSSLSPKHLRVQWQKNKWLCNRLRVQHVSSVKIFEASNLISAGKRNASKLFDNFYKALANS